MLSNTKSAGSLHRERERNCYAIDVINLLQSFYALHMIKMNLYSLSTSVDNIIFYIELN